METDLQLQDKGILVDGTKSFYPKTVFGFAPKYENFVIETCVKQVNGDLV